MYIWYWIINSIGFFMEFKKFLFGENIGYFYYIKNKNIFDYFNIYISFVIVIICFCNKYKKMFIFNNSKILLWLVNIKKKY